MMCLCACVGSASRALELIVRTAALDLLKPGRGTQNWTVFALPHSIYPNGDACSCADLRAFHSSSEDLAAATCFSTAPAAGSDCARRALISATAFFAFNAIIMEWSPAGARVACGIETVRGGGRGEVIVFPKPLISADGEDDSPREVVGAAPPRGTGTTPCRPFKSTVLEGEPSLT